MENQGKTIIYPSLHMPCGSRMRSLSFVLVAIVLSTLTAGIAAAETGAVTIPAFRDSDVLTLTLRSGDIIDFSWSSSGSVDFSVDLVGGVGVFSQVGQVGSGMFQVPFDGTYVFTFRNDNLSQVTVSWSIGKRGDVLPWVVGAAAFALVGIAGFAIWRQRQRRTLGTRMAPQSLIPPLR